MLYFNLDRINMESHKTPFEIMKERTNIRDPNFMNFPPIILDYLEIFSQELLTPGYDLSDDITPASVNRHRYQYWKDLKRVLCIGGLPCNFKDMIKLSKRKEALW